MAPLGLAAAERLGAAVGAAWLWRRRNRYRRMARPLNPTELAAMSAYFDPGLLNEARIAKVQTIDPPLPRWLRRGRLRSLDLRGAAGMAFIDTVVIVTRPNRPNEHTSTLFHELVHIQQYRMLGVRRFAGLYFRGYIETGEYAAIPLEVDAYDLTGRFTGGDTLRVLPELQQRFKARRW